MTESVLKRSLPLLISALWIYAAVVCVAMLEGLVVALAASHLDVPQENFAALESSLDTMGIFLFVSLFTIPAIVLFLICEKVGMDRFWKRFSFWFAASPLLVYLLLALKEDTTDSEVYDIAKCGILVFLSHAGVAFVILLTRDYVTQAQPTKR